MDVANLGRLKTWQEVEPLHDWTSLLLGNGASINVWSGFAYESLYERACATRVLRPIDSDIFENLGAHDFERVLAALTEASRVTEALSFTRETKSILRTKLDLQRKLGEAVHVVHPRYSQVSSALAMRIQEALSSCRNVFTTNYDLLTYWSLMQAGRDGLTDFFRGAGRPFDPRHVAAGRHDDRTRLHFLHGALHLVEAADGRTFKRQQGELGGLLEQFGQPYRGDAGATPLVVTEASSLDKQRRIDRNSYLKACWQELRRCDGPLVIFGHRLAAQDGHLVEALAQHRRRPVAVALRDHGAERTARRALDVLQKFPVGAEVTFFDAKTHPLGEEVAAAKRRPVRS